MSGIDSATGPSSHVGLLVERCPRVLEFSFFFSRFSFNSKSTRPEKLRGEFTQLFYFSFFFLFFSSLSLSVTCFFPCNLAVCVCVCLQPCSQPWRFSVVVVLQSKENWIFLDCIQFTWSDFDLFYAYLGTPIFNPDMVAKSTIFTGCCFPLWRFPAFFPISTPSPRPRLVSFPIIIISAVVAFHGCPNARLVWVFEAATCCHLALVSNWHGLVRRLGSFAPTVHHYHHHLHRHHHHTNKTKRDTSAPQYDSAQLPRLSMYTRCTKHIFLRVDEILSCCSQFHHFSGLPRGKQHNWSLSTKPTKDNTKSLSGSTFLTGT